jgi:HAAS domain-containing protein
MCAWGIGKVSADRSDVEAYLDRVSARLHMPGDASGAILDELEAHIDDAISSGLEDGLARDDAERRALDRLGSPDDLGEELRRAHQTRRRLLAAAGAGVWHGAQGVVRGYFGGYIASLPLVFVAMFAALILEAPLGIRSQFHTTSVIFGLSIWVAIWGATWLSARTVVEAFSRRSFRSIESIRGPIAWCGAAVVAIPVVLLPADHTLLTVAMALVTPFVFALGAISVDAELWDQLGPPAWERRLPRLRRIAFVAFVLVVLGIPFAMIPLGQSGGSSSNREPESETTSASQRWATAGYAVVASTVVDYDAIWVADGFPQDGFIVARIPDDRVDWDEWRGLRFEVWRATAAADQDPRGTLLGTQPMAVIAMTDPWRQPATPVRVGYPGADGFLLFLVGEDRVTGARVAFGHPEGGESRFHGSLLDWFRLT